MTKDEPKEQKPDAVEQGVNEWVADHLRNTPFSQDTAAWNHLQGALPLLGPIIKRHMGETV